MVLYGYCNEQNEMGLEVWRRNGVRTFGLLSRKPAALGFSLCPVILQNGLAFFIAGSRGQSIPWLAIKKAL